MKKKHPNNQPKNHTNTNTTFSLYVKNKPSTKNAECIMTSQQTTDQKPKRK
jgi:hypothetical protein